MKICRKFGRLTTHVITPLFILFFTLLCGYTPAQANGVWVILDEVEFPPRFKAPTDFSAAALDLAALQDLLEGAPRETPGSASSVMIPVLLPDGSLQEVAVVLTQLMESSLAIQFPEIKTYAFESANARDISGQMVVGPEGIQLAAQTPDGLFVIEPVETVGGMAYLSFLDFARTDGSKIIEHPEDEHPPVPTPPTVPAVLAAGGLTPGIQSLESGNTLRIYRFTAATTGEFYQARLAPDNPNLGDNLEVLFTIAADIVSVNAVLEPELSIRFIIAANSLNVFYDDPNTDPFEQNDDPNTNDNDPNTSGDIEGKPCDLRGENRTNAVDNAALNNADYDLAFLFATQSGGGNAGCAWFNVCGEGAGTDHKSAAAGKIGNNGTNSAAGLILHESGHQLGANHTYSGLASGCDVPNFSETGSGPKPSAFAPGSGTSIMSYNNNCGSDNVGVLTDVDVGTVPDGGYYHTASFHQIIDNITNGNGANCGSSQATGNLAPVVDAGPDYTIPSGTPFTLTGSAVDADPLTYVWEQFDLAATQRAIDTDDGVGPIIRSVPPTADPSRTIPNLPNLLAGTTPTKGEILPSMDRNLTFRLTARDNRMGGGGVNDDTMVVTVNGDPFFLTSPNGGETFFTGCPVPVTWTVGGGNVANQVDILFSEDGGETFPTTLLAATANDGDEVATLTCATSGQARMKAQAVDNIFFDISDSNFTVVPSPPMVDVSASGGEVDDSCEFLVTFDATVTDDCGVNQADVIVKLHQQAMNYSLGAPTVNKMQVNATTVTLNGSVLVSDLTSSPAILGIEVEAEDLCGTGADDFAEVEVSDTIPPTISVGLDPGMLWPPNHKLVDIEATVVAEDNCPGVSFELVSASSDEPDNGPADGNTTDDIQDAETGTPDVNFKLRAERAGNGDGRTYTATYTATDGSDNEATDSDTVEVPHDQMN